MTHDTPSGAFLERLSPAEHDSFCAVWQRIRGLLDAGYSPESAAKVRDLWTAWISDPMRNEGRRYLDPEGKQVSFGDLPETFWADAARELFADVPEDEVAEFCLLEVFGCRRRYDAEAWSAQKAHVEHDRLRIGGYRVMGGWEVPLMHQMVDLCLEECRAASPRVLEIGWGLGLAGRRFLENGVSDYTVIEAHAEVAEAARRTVGSFTDAGAVIHSLWQDAELPEASFDIVFYDTHIATWEGFDRRVDRPEPPSKDWSGGVTRSEEAAEWVDDHLREIVARFLPMLSDGGVLTYLCGNKPEQVSLLLEAGFRSVSCSLSVELETPEDWWQWWADRILLLVARK